MKLDFRLQAYTRFWAAVFLYGVCVFGWSLLRPGLGRVGGLLEGSAR